MLLTKESSRFAMDEAEGVYNSFDRCIYLTKAKTSPGQIEFQEVERPAQRNLQSGKSERVEVLV